MSASSAPVRFFAEQSRIRAQTWRVTAAAVLLAICLGLLASAGLAPILLAVSAILIRLVDLVTGGAFEPVRQGLSQFIATAFADLDALLNNSQSFIKAVSPQSLAGLWRFGVLMLPGFALTGLCYFWLLKRISSRSDDALAAALEARPAQLSVEGEGETLRITQELCIMAGIAVPEVLVTEHSVPNLAICGKDYTSWTLVTTSGFASGLDRHEKRGAIACAVAQISDGDLDVNAAVSALGSITGLMSTLLDWPVSRAARQRLAVVRAELFASSGSPATIERRLHAAVDERLDEVNAIDQDSLTWLQKARGYLLAPFHIISFAFTMLASLWSRILVAGVIGFMLRRRCFKSDAAAARLIGDADLVAKGVSAVSGPGGLPAGGAFWAPFFLSPGRMTARAGAAAADTNIAQSFFPGGDARLKRLARLGASMGQTVDSNGHRPLWAYAVMALVGLLLMIAAGLFSFLLAVFAAFFVTASVGIGYGLMLLIL